MLLFKPQSRHTLVGSEPGPGYPPTLKVPTTVLPSAPDKLASTVLYPLPLTHPTQPHWLLLSSQHAQQIPVSVALRLLFCLPGTVFAPKPSQGFAGFPQMSPLQGGLPRPPCVNQHLCPSPARALSSFFNHSAFHYLTLTCLLLLPSLFPSLFSFVSLFPSFPLSRVSLTMSPSLCFRGVCSLPSPQHHSWHAVGAQSMCAELIAHI